MSTTLCVGMEDSAELELQGAAQRLAVARQELANFLVEQGAVLDGHSTAPSLRTSIERQHAALQLELDEATRHYRHSFDQVLRLRRTPSPR